VDQDKLQTAIRIANSLLENKELSSEHRIQIEHLIAELESGIKTKKLDSKRIKEIVKELFDWLMLLKPVLKDIIESWIQGNF
jgi:DNA repair exonuclease SbcCD ATPase subunit